MIGGEYLAKLMFDTREDAERFHAKLKTEGKDPSIESFPTGWTTVRWFTTNEEEDVNGN